MRLTVLSFCFVVFAGCESQTIRQQPVKMTLIERVGSALKSKNVAELRALYLSEQDFENACDPPTAFYRPKDEDLEACLNLVDWSSAKKLALNYGGEIYAPLDSCPSLRDGESTEMFFEVNDATVKVRFRTIYRGDRAYLSGKLSCRIRKSIQASGFGCSAYGWPTITQRKGVDLGCQ